MKKTMKEKIALAYNAFRNNEIRGVGITLYLVSWGLVCKEETCVGISSRFYPVFLSLLLRLVILSI